MHEYSIDVESKNILFCLAVLSITISGVLTSWLNKLIEAIPIVNSNFTISIAVISVFGMLYWGFDKYIWKCKLLQKTNIIRTPDLNGVWEGKLQSSFDNFEKEFPATLTIEQTWSKIYIRGKFNDSSSISYTASLKVNKEDSIRLIYSYYNDKYQKSYNKNISNHRGYGSLEINNNKMRGIYFNNPTNNKNHGYLNLSKCS